MSEIQQNNNDTLKKKLNDSIRSSQTIPSNMTETEKTKMQTILTKQKEELNTIVTKYKESKSDVIWDGKQNKADLLKEIHTTIQNLKNGNGVAGVSTYLDSAEETYKKLEAKITGTTENVDFRDSDFIIQAIANLEDFEKALEQTNTTESKIEAPAPVPEPEPEPKIEAPAPADVQAPTLVDKSAPVDVQAPASTNDFLKDVVGPKGKEGKWPKAEYEKIRAELDNITDLNTLATELQEINKVDSLKEVLLVQLALTKLGYKPGTIDGIYRDVHKNKSETIEAVKAFQLKNGLIHKIEGAKGQVGPKTIAKMVAELSKIPTVTGVVSGNTYPTVTPAFKDTPTDINTTTPAAEAQPTQPAAKIEESPEAKVKANQEAIAQQFTFEGKTPEPNDIDASATYPEMKFRNWALYNGSPVVIKDLKVDLLSGAVLSWKFMVNDKEIGKSNITQKMPLDDKNVSNLAQALTDQYHLSTTESRADQDKKMDEYTLINKALTTDKVLENVTPDANWVYKNIKIDGKIYNIMEKNTWAVDTTNLNLAQSLAPNQKWKTFNLGKYALMELIEEEMKVTK